MSWLLKVDRALAGQPNAVLTCLLLALAAFGAAVALWAPPTFKAAILAWWVLP